MTKQEYIRIEDAGNGYKSVNIFDMSDPNDKWVQPKLAFHHDESHDAGIWGLIDKSGKETIKPKYLFPLHFTNGVSMAVKGKWEYRDNWKHRSGPQKGYWTEKELWGLIDIHEKELIPFKYAELRYIDDFYDKDGSKLSRYVAWTKFYDKNCAGVYDSRGDIVIPFKYADIDYFTVDEQIVFCKNQEMNYTGAECGVYDIKLGKEIIKAQPEYACIEIIKRGLYYVSDEAIQGFDGYLMNSKEERISKHTFRMEPRETPIKNIYKGELSDGRSILFKISKKDIEITKEFTTVYVEGWQIECCGDEEPFNIDDDVKWYVSNPKEKFSPNNIGKVDYIYESHGAPDLTGLSNTYVIKGKISKMYDHYYREKNDSKPYGDFAREVEKTQRWNSESNSGLPFVGWGIILENAKIETAYSDEEIEAHKKQVKIREEKEKRKAKRRAFFKKIKS